MTWSICFVVATCVAGCGDGGESRPTTVTEAPAVDAGAYSAALAAFLPATGADERPVVWITRLGAEPLSLDDQVEMIASVESTHDLRFVDDPEAAVVDGGDNPREDGLLLGIGEIRSESPHTVRVEVFSDQRRVRAELVTLVNRADGWEIEGREVVDPEDLVVDE